MKAHLIVRINVLGHDSCNSHFETFRKLKTDQLQTILCDMGSVIKHIVDTFTKTAAEKWQE